MKPTLPVLTLNAQAARGRGRGHPWIFSNEVADAPKVAPGALVEVRAGKGREAWTAYYNPNSLIAARVLDRAGVPIDAEWFAARVEDAAAYRRRLALPRDALRWVYGEADGLPGLVVDGYGDVAVVQSLTAGMDQLLPLALEAVAHCIVPSATYVRCDGSTRALEGLEARAGWHGEARAGETGVDWYGLALLVDVERGHKTGLYLDQSENIQRLAAFASGAQALDICCYTGVTSLALARAGAAHVTAIDASSEAIGRLQQQAERNGLGAIETQVGDAFDLLPALQGREASFDLINLDPPAFAPRKKDVQRALRGYRELNRRALQLLRPRGIFCTSTCSHHVTPEMFLTMLGQAAADAKRVLRIMEVRGQAPDHPVLPHVPQTRYLTCVLVEVA